MIRYQPSGFDYGDFGPWPDSPISVLVRTVIAVGQGPLTAFRVFVDGRTVGPSRATSSRPSWHETSAPGPGWRGS